LGLVRRKGSLGFRVGQEAISVLGSSGQTPSEQPASHPAHHSQRSVDLIGARYFGTKEKPRLRRGEGLHCAESVKIKW
jgi:hypothetical protein